jgi:hypothetical protein
MANLRAWRGTSAEPSSLPRLQFKAQTGQHVLVPVGGNANYGTVLSTGLHLILDFGAHWEGEVAYQPKFDDSRMKLRGGELPQFSGDDGYMGGVKINVLVQNRGLCSLLSTSESMCRTIDWLFDAFMFAPEAHNGQLPVYRIEPPRSFKTKFRPDPLYAAVYSQVGWIHRDDNAFGPRLIPPPRPMLVPEVVAGPGTKDNNMFNAISPHGEVIPPEPTPAAAPKSLKRMPESTADLQGRRSIPISTIASPFDCNGPQG